MPRFLNLVYFLYSIDYLFLWSIHCYWTNPWFLLSDKIHVLQGHEDFVSAIEGLDTFGGSSQSCLVATGEASFDCLIANL